MFGCFGNGGEERNEQLQPSQFPPTITGGKLLLRGVRKSRVSSRSVSVAPCAGAHVSVRVTFCQRKFMSTQDTGLCLNCTQLIRLISLVGPYKHACELCASRSSWMQFVTHSFLFYCVYSLCRCANANSHFKNCYSHVIVIPCGKTNSVYCVIGGIVLVS